MKSKKGFTLVELLAVIVILAIIMIIAIPSVLQIMYVSNKKNFENYLTRLNNETMKVVAEERLNGTFTESRIYNIEKELGLSSTGDFKGYTLVVPKSDKVYITLYNKQFAFVAREYNKSNLKKIELVDKVDRNKLTPEYLCSQVEECTECTYLAIDEEGNETINVITPEKHEYDALLQTGYEWKNTMNKLVPIAQITEIRYSDTVPETKQTVSLNTSNVPVYMWNEGNIIYYSSEAEKIYLNSNSNEMFKDLINCTRIDTDKFRFDEVTEASYMFYNDQNLLSLDTTNWNFKNIVNLGRAFSNLKKIEKLDVSNWNAKIIKNINYIFAGDVNLKGTLDFSKWSFTSLEQMAYTFSECENIEYVILPKTNTKIVSLSGTWNYCKKLKHITNLETFDVSHVKLFNLTFKLCNSIDEINMSNWNMPNVTDMDWTFQQCFLVKELDFSGFNFSKLTKFNGMFYSTTNLERVIFKNKDFSNVKSMSNTFVASGIIEVDFSNAIMPKVTTMKTMFQSCSRLQKVNFSNIKATSLQDMTQTFTTDKELEVIDLTGFEAPVIEILNQTFFNCRKLKELDLSGFNDAHLTNVANMCNSCSVLTTIYASKDWNLSSDALKSGTFAYCQNLKNQNTGFAYATGKTTGDYAKVNGGYFTLKG